MYYFSIFSVEVYVIYNNLNLMKFTDSEYNVESIFLFFYPTDDSTFLLAILLFYFRDESSFPHISNVHDLKTFCLCFKSGVFEGRGIGSTQVYDAYT